MLSDHLLLYAHDFVLKMSNLSLWLDSVFYGHSTRLIHAMIIKQPTWKIIMSQQGIKVAVFVILMADVTHIADDISYFLPFK